MNRIYLAIVVVSFSMRPAVAQRLDGCVHVNAVFTTSQAPPGQALDLGLRDLGMGLSRESVKAAVDDRRPEVRSLAALNLAEVGTNADLDKLIQAWLGETDVCTKSSMGLALQVMVPRLAFDVKQHPDGQHWITPFRACAPSYPEVVKLTVEQDSQSGSHAPVVRITARNQTERTVAFLKAPPEELFSVSVLGPAGEPAKFADGRKRMFEPVGPRSLDLAIGKMPVFIPLPPQEDVAMWTWSLASDFDVSTPGTYLVSLGGRVSYLNTTVCSTTATVTVER